METSQLNLTDDERVLLAALLLDSSVRARRRSRIVLDLASGKDSQTIARELLTRRARAEYVRSAFLEKRLDIFSTASRKRASVSPPPHSDSSAPSNPLTMHQAALEILSRQFEKLRQMEDGVKKGEDSEAVHDMRVACRRLNSAFRLFRGDLPAKPVKRLRPTLEKLRDTLGQVRNLDVLLQDLTAFCADSPQTEASQLQVVVEAWQNERAQVQKTLIELLESPAYTKWRERMEAFLLQEDDASSTRVAHVLPALVWKQYGAVRAYETKLAAASLEELHTLRIEIKRLRYTLEFFRDVFTQPAAPDPVELLVKLQDRLGSIQDAVVAGEALADFIVSQALAAKKRHEPVAEFQGIAEYHSHLNARIDELRKGLPEEWNKISSLAFREQLARMTSSL